jgi:hypothetical protein
VFTPPSCGQIPGALYCDDFEGGLNPMLRRSASGGATIVVDSTRPRGGKMSLHARSAVTAYADATLNLGKPVFPTANNSFFMRAFVYWGTPPASDNIYVFRINGVLPGTSSSIYALLGTVGDPYDKPTAANFKHLIQLIYHSSIKTADHFAYQNHAAPEAPYGRWACWELEVDGVNNVWRVWVDGVEQFTRTWNGMAGTPWVVGAPNSFTIGLNHPHDEAAGIEVWYDDLVLASKRVGCN